jgi:hypothetical protein
LASSKCTCCLCGRGKIGCTYKRHDSTTIPRGYLPRQKCRRRNVVNTSFRRIFFLPKFDDERMLHSTSCQRPETWGRANFHTSFSSFLYFLHNVPPSNFFF